MNYKNQFNPFCCVKYISVEGSVMTEVKREWEVCSSNVKFRR